MCAFFTQANQVKNQIAQLIEAGLHSLVEDGLLPAGKFPDIKIERARDQSHGDFACNIAMILAKEVGRPPRDLAQSLVDKIPAVATIDRIEIAGPGFINFFLSETAQHAIIELIIREGDSFGHSDKNRNKKALVEFVSANPTGPLHVGHGRGAA